MILRRRHRENINFRKELSRHDRKLIEDNVKAGVKVLNRNAPGWFRKGSIALSRLNLEDTDACVCGQLAAKRATGTSYFCGVVLGIRDYDPAHGFDFPYGLDRESDSNGFKADEQMVWAYLGLQWENAIRKLRDKA